MKEILLCKYGEIALKGLNKSTFEAQLKRTLAHRLAPLGSFDICLAQSTIRIEPQEDTIDLDAALDVVLRVFGLSGVSRAAVVEKDIEAIKRAAADYLPPFLRGAKTFKAQAKRSDKRFPMTSPEIAGEVGAVLLETMPGLRASMENPDVLVTVEIRDHAAYIHAGQLRGAGGIPVGSSGKGLLLLSGGIDSPVAGYMMAKRGMLVEALHFESFPYTSERAREKVLSLAGIMAGYCGDMQVHVVSLTHIQEELRDHCAEEYFTLLLRRFMMRLANRVARQYHCLALITGESLGQVASQTIHALNVTDALAEYPVFRPCIGMDKEEIVSISRRIDTYETSILPYEDCCTVFTPRHPKTRPELDNILREENKIDIAALEEEAMASLRTYPIARM